ncbi:MAG: hypothetical protein ACI8Y4_005380 [Candidatus Poriferisodalaceae bacterium]|jgi:hypothetical protein
MKRSRSTSVPANSDVPPQWTMPSQAQVSSRTLRSAKLRTPASGAARSHVSSRGTFRSTALGTLGRLDD